MGCSNCFNGCAETISDKCVKYTGVDVPELGISNGDPLLVVEQQFTQYIKSVISGQGIIPTILPGDLCALIVSFLPVLAPINLNNVISATFKSICNIDTRLIAAEGKLTALNADYDIDCLTGVVATSDTHEVLQAVIDKLCLIDSSLTTLSAELTANYVTIADIDSFIETYLASLPTSTLYSSKMVPYVAVPYFGPIVGNFDITGAGIGDWANIYLCNGQNLTPDLRGRTLVGATTMGSTPFNPAVDPAIPGNPTYALNDTTGGNLAFLTDVSQIPLHSHSATIEINDPGHIHTYSVHQPYFDSVNHSGSDNGVNDSPTTLNTSSQFTGLKGNGPGQNVFVTVGNTGSSPSSGHSNIQPVHATNYIIYIP